MKRIRIGAAVLSTLFLLTACGGTSGQDAAGEQNPAEENVVTEETGGEKVELTVFAAASLTETLTALAEQYQTVAPNVELVYNFDSSGTLQTQIEEGAVCDLFLSAGQKQMDALGDLVKADSRIDLLQNTVVLIAPADSETAPTSFETIGDASLIAVGGPDVPVGQYTEEILTKLGLWEQLNADGKLTFGSNVKEVTSQVAEAAVDCGVVYRTDAAAEPGVKVIVEAPADSYSPAIYPAAVTASTEHPEEAQAFLDYLQTDEASAVFEAAGFQLVG